MSVGSSVSCALLSAVTAFALVTAAGCGTDAKGVDDCRDIEEARCAAAKNCGIVSDVAACQNYYRDQCLHGLAVAPPGSSVINACVATIRAAGMCALEGTDTAPAACSSPIEGTTAKTTCEIVTNPEETSECSFLTPPADAGGGSGGSGGTGGKSGAAGASGESGAGEGGSSN